MQHLYYIQPDTQRKPSAREDKFIIDISFDHLVLSSFHDDQLLSLDLYSTDTNDRQLAIDQLSALLSDHPLMDTSFDHVKVIYHTPESVLVPGALYHEDAIGPLLHWQAGDAENHIPMKNFIKQTNRYLLYAVPDALHQIVSAHFPNAQFVHAHSAAASRVYASPQTIIDIEVYPTEWICSFWSNGKLQLIRSINASSADDLSYILLHICQQKNIVPSETSISMSGLIEKKDERIQLLSRFFKSIEWNEEDLDITHPKHFFTAIIQQSLCEL